jgi:hypothetical protein
MADLDNVPEEEAPVEEVPPLEEVEDEEAEPAPRAIDPAFAYIILLILALLGLTNLAADVRYTLLWSLLTLVGLLAIILDKVSIEAPNVRNLLIGLGFGAMVGVPLMAVGAPQLQRISLSVFGRLPDSAVFQVLAFTMPLAETLYFRGAFQAARGLIFASAAGAAWSTALFFPQLEVLKFPFVAFVIALSFLIANFVYSYVRERFGLFASWSCQIAVNLLLLFVVRFL